MLKKALITGFKWLWLAFLFCNHLLFTFIIANLDTDDDNDRLQFGEHGCSGSVNNFSFGSYTPSNKDFEYSRNSRM